MPMVTAQIIPFEIRDGLRIVVHDVKMGAFDAALVLQRPIAIDAGAKVLLIRTDLSPSQMRIIGSGRITEITEKIILNKRKVREGKIQRIRDGDVLVEGLASSKSVAESIVRKQVTTTSGAVGIIKTPFGTRGVVSVEFDNPVKQDEVVQYERLVEEEFRFGS
ncbi:hypothetical protein E4H12_14165 [Candidatus Thorarchaeota archaeon]|nr:MAG: hypothetical protein E4H12_14165 [Candidatus Thorarchaeota archaeon]